MLSGKLRKLRGVIGRAGEIAAWIFVLWIVIGGFVGWLIGVPGDRKTIQEGQPCGPGYVWTSTGGIDPDLSCEKER
jgi:hypothetical protein